MPWPRACCARDGLLQAGELLGWEQCQDRSPGYIHEQVGHDPVVSLSCPQCFPGSWQWGSTSRTGARDTARLWFCSPVAPQVLSLS